MKIEDTWNNEVKFCKDLSKILGVKIETLKTRDQKIEIVDNVIKIHGNGFEGYILHEIAHFIL